MIETHFNNLLNQNLIKIFQEIIFFRNNGRKNDVYSSEKYTCIIRKKLIHIPHKILEYFLKCKHRLTDMWKVIFNWFQNVDFRYYFEQDSTKEVSQLHSKVPNLVFYLKIAYGKLINHLSLTWNREWNEKYRQINDHICLQIGINLIVVFINTFFWL